jgi:hypothetical protein
MPRYVLDVPRTENEQIVALADYERVAPRTLLVWLVKLELAKRLCKLEAPTESAGA